MDDSRREDFKESRNHLRVKWRLFAGYRRQVEGTALLGRCTTSASKVLTDCAVLLLSLSYGRGISPRTANSYTG
jgi:hypothetical protein